MSGAEFNREPRAFNANLSEHLVILKKLAGQEISFRR